MESVENMSVNAHELVKRLNDQMADLMVPAVVYIVVLMVTGTVGNIMVCFYYGYRTKITTNSLFIVVLAVYDLIVCLICMPTEIADIEFYYTFKNGSACKVLRLLNYFAGIGSILTLVAIAVDRYRRIRHATRKQMSLYIAKMTSFGIAVVAAILSWPSAVLYGSITVEIPNDTNRNLTGFDCTSTKDRTYRPYVWAFNGTHAVLFLVCTLILIVLYAVIGVSMFQHKRRMSRHSKTLKTPEKVPVTSTPTNSSNITSQSDLLCQRQVARQNKVETRSSLKSHEQPQVKEFQVEDNVRIPNVRKSTPDAIDPEAVKVTIVMVTITTLFILSFLPYLSLTIWRVIEGQHEAQFLSDGGLVGFKIGSRSFLLNSAFNPWVYGIFNSKFRRYFFHLLCCTNARN